MLRADRVLLPNRAERRYYSEQYSRRQTHGGQKSQCPPVERKIQQDRGPATGHDCASWRRRRPGPAPRAIRKLISCRRPLAWASSKLARFIHAIKRTSATAPIRIRSGSENCIRTSPNPLAAGTTSSFGGGPVSLEFRGTLANR